MFIVLKAVKNCIGGCPVLFFTECCVMVVSRVSYQPKRPLQWIMGNPFQIWCFSFLSTKHRHTCEFCFCFQQIIMRTAQTNMWTRSYNYDVLVQLRRKNFCFLEFYFCFLELFTGLFDAQEKCRSRWRCPQSHQSESSQRQAILVCIMNYFINIDIWIFKMSDISQNKASYDYLANLHHLQGCAMVCGIPSAKHEVISFGGGVTKVIEPLLTDHQHLEFQWVQKKFSNCMVSILLLLLLLFPRRAGRASMGLDLFEQAKKFCQDGLAVDKNNAELKSLYHCHSQYYFTQCVLPLRIRQILVFHKMFCVN